jgi:hypothetical protein
MRYSGFYKLHENEARNCLSRLSEAAFFTETLRLTEKEGLIQIEFFLPLWNQEMSAHSRVQMHREFLKIS